MGRTSILAFLKDYEKRATEQYDFRSIDDEYDDLPSGSGGYVIRADRRVTWPYPWGSSPVFYIGKARSLRDRLWDHWNDSKQHRKQDYSPDWMPVHVYEAAYASSYYMVPTWQGMSPDSLEKEMIGRFVNWYGARPVANGQTRWDRV